MDWWPCLNMAMESKFRPWHIPPPLPLSRRTVKAQSMLCNRMLSRKMPQGSRVCKHNSNIRTSPAGLLETNEFTRWRVRDVARRETYPRNKPQEKQVLFCRHSCFFSWITPQILASEMSCINKIKNVEQKHEAHRAAWKQTKAGKKQCWRPGKCNWMPTWIIFKH